MRLGVLPAKLCASASGGSVSQQGTKTGHEGSGRTWVTEAQPSEAPHRSCVSTTAPYWAPLRISASRIAQRRTPGRVRRACEMRLLVLETARVPKHWSAWPVLPSSSADTIRKGPGRGWALAKPAKGTQPESQVQPSLPGLSRGLPMATSKRAHQRGHLENRGLHALLVSFLTGAAADHEQTQTAGVGVEPCALIPPGSPRGPGPGPEGSFQALQGRSLVVRSQLWPRSEEQSKDCPPHIVRLPGLPAQKRE